jgi:hypothetical protein
MIPMESPSLAFVADRADAPGVEVRVNFGIFAGRAASPAEIDRLAEWLLDGLDTVTIVCEERHVIGGEAEASVQQVRIELAPEAVPADDQERRALAERLVERADYWARSCIASRGPDNGDL